MKWKIKTAVNELDEYSVRGNLDPLEAGVDFGIFFIGPHIWREYWCSSQEAESREISISCKDLFLNRCKINMFELDPLIDFVLNNCDLPQTV